MREYLPGNLQSRLVELRDAYGFKSGTEVAEALEINRTTYNRIENGSTKTISSDLLIKLAKLYGVTTDYILGLTDVRENTGYDIEELGLSVEAAKNLYIKQVDPSVVNELLTNRKFALLSKQLATYFSGISSEMAKTGNQVNDFMIALLSESVNAGKLPDNDEILNLRKQIQGKKSLSTQAELDRIRITFLSCVKEIKDKVQEELKGYVDAQLLTSDIIEAIKENAMKELSDNYKSLKEKAEAMAFITTEAMKMDSTFDSETIDKVAPNIQGLFAALAATDDEEEKK